MSGRQTLLDSSVMVTTAPRLAADVCARRPPRCSLIPLLCGTVNIVFLEALALSVLSLAGSEGPIV